MKISFLILPFIAIPVLCAQPDVAALYNNSPDAPVTITGNVTCPTQDRSHHPASGELSFTNGSRLGIVALEAVAKVKCRDGSGQSVRYHHSTLFFKVHGLEPGDRISDSIPDLPDIVLQDPQPPTKTPIASSRVEVQVRFVLFEDGSVWGDRDAITALRLRRKKIESLLARLLAAPTDQEFDSVLDAALSPTSTQDPFATSAAFKVNLVRKESGAESARANVRDQLRIAAEREASGKF